MITTGKMQTLESYNTPSICHANDTLKNYCMPLNSTSQTNEESELAFVKGLRTGKITI
jgi:hypothetical protein